MSEWSVIDRFGVEWRFSVVPMEARGGDAGPSHSARVGHEDPIADLVYGLGGGLDPLDGTRAEEDGAEATLLAILSAVMGDASSVVTASGADADGTSPTGESVARALHAAVERGWLRFERAPQPAWPFPDALEDSAPPLGPESVVEERTTSIGLRLVDPMGDPVPNVRYRVTLPGGATREGKLSADGTAQIEGIDEGSCVVDFPDLDGRECRA